MKQVLQYQYCHICFSFLPPTVLNVMIYRQLITLCHYFIALRYDFMNYLFILDKYITDIIIQVIYMYSMHACSIMCKKNDVY